MDGLVAALTMLAALLGLPLYAVFGGASMAFFAGDDREGSMSFAGAEFFTEKFADSNLTVTIPLFIFAGYVLAKSGTPRRLVRLSRAWLGWIPGGLAIVCIMASAFFTTFTGGSGITIVAVGGLLLPALLSEKYEENFSLGLVTTGGSLGLLFPPSLPIILYAIVAGISITELFLAGFLPGLLTILILVVYAIYVGSKSKQPTTPFDMREAYSATREAVWEILLPVLLVGGLITGVFLPIHQAAAFAASYALIVQMFVYKDIGRADLMGVIRESMTMFGAILVILATAIGFTGYLTDAQVPEAAFSFLGRFIDEPWMFLLFLNIFLLFVGMLMDVFSAIVVVVPLVATMATAPIDAGGMGMDPYHLGIIFILNLEIGYLTPPVGLNLFIASLRFDKPVTQLYRAVLPFIGLLVVALLITTYVEQLSLWMTGFADSSDRIDLNSPEGEGAPSGDDNDLLNEIMGGEDDDDFNLDSLDDGDEGDFNLDSLEDDDGDFNLDSLEDDEGDFNLDSLEGDDPADDDTLGDESAGDGEFTLDDLEGDL